MTAALQRTFHGLVNLLAAALDVDSDGSPGHSSRVALLGQRVAAALGGVDPAVVYYAGLVHDVGGAGLEEHLTEHAERGFDDKTSQSHPLLGKLLLSGCPALAPLLPLVEHHHERIDGRGFPAGRSAGELPAGASVVHLADALEIGLRSAASGGRQARAFAVLRELRSGAVPRAVADAAAAALESEPGLLDLLYDPQRLRAAHAAEPVLPGFLPAGDRIEVLTPLLALVSRVVDARHHLTADHSMRVAWLGGQIARELSAEVLDPWDVIWAALLHDAGKISLPRQQLASRTSASDRGADGRDGHPEQTRLLLRAIPGLGHLALAAAAHHERYQGGGPLGLAGEQIPLIGRILAIADRYDTLRTRGPEGSTRTHLELVPLIQRDAGQALDRRLAEVALGVLEQLDRNPVHRRGAPLDWRQLGEGPAAETEPAPGPAGQRPARRGSLLIELEPFVRATLTGGLAFGGGAQEFFALCGEPAGQDVAAALAEESAAELAAAAAALAPGAVFTRYLFTRDRRPIEAILQREGAGFSLLARGAENRLQTLDRLALFYRSFLSSYEAVVFTDPTGRIIDVNRCFLDLFGYKLGEIIGQHTRVLGSGRHAEELYRRMWGALTDPAVGHWSGELVDRRRDGREVHVQLRISAVRDSSGACMGYVAHHLDISERKRHEAEAARRDEELRNKNAELERLGQFKNEIIAITSHDLKAPLASVAGVAELLREGLQALPRERVEAYLERISTSARSMMSFIDDLLDLEKLDSGALRLEPGRLHLGALLARCVERADAAARGKVRVELAPPGPALPVIAGDPVRLEQVFDNLIANALKFSPAQGRVTVSVRQAGSVLLVTVEDEGPGVPPAQLSAIFARYHQVDRAGVPKRGFGAGLGLSIVQRLVDLHGGRVWAENRATGGCRFSVELPVEQGLAVLRRPVVVVAAPLSAEVAELAELFHAHDLAVRRVESLGEAAQLVQILDADVLLVAEGLPAAGHAQLALAVRQGGRAPLRVLLTRGLDAPPEGFDATLSPPFLDEEIRSLAARASAAA